MKDKLLLEKQEVNDYSENVKRQMEEKFNEEKKLLDKSKETIVQENNFLVCALIIITFKYTRLVLNQVWLGWVGLAQLFSEAQFSLFFLPSFFLTYLLLESTHLISSFIRFSLFYSLVWR